MLTKKCFLGVMLGVFLVLPFAFNAMAMPISPYRVEGTLTVDGNVVSGTNAAYTIKITKADGSEYKDVNSKAYSELRTGGVPNNALGALGSSYSGKYAYDIPMYVAPVIDPDTNEVDDAGVPLGANVNDNVYIHVYYNGTELQISQILNASGTAVTQPIPVGASAAVRTLNIVAVTPQVATISITGRVQDPSGNYVSGIKVEVAGNASIPAVYTNSNGQYTVTGIPSGQDFTLRFTMNGALPTYTPIFKLTENTTLSTYSRLYPANWTTNPANEANMGIIHGRIRESGPNWETSLISGATVSPSTGTATGTAEYSINGYTIGGTSTFANGQWFVRNVTPDTVVTVEGTKDGTTIQSRRYMAFADGVTSGALFATADTGTIWVTGRILDGSNGSSAGNVTVSLAGGGAKTAITNGDGSFTLTKIPSNVPFTLKFSKTGYVDSYIDFAACTTNIPYFIRSAVIFPTTAYTSWSVETGKGVISGSVRDSANPSTLNLEGVIVDAGSYTVTYRSVDGTFGGTSTYSNGQIFVFNVLDGATVTLNGSKAGYTFNQNTAKVHAGAVTLTSLTGTATGGETVYTISGTVKNLSNQAIANATVTIKNAATNTTVTTTTTNTSGFYRVELGSAGTYTLTVNKTGYEDSSPPDLVYVDGSNPNATVNLLMQATSGGSEADTILLTSGWNFVSFWKLPACVSPSDPSCNAVVTIFGDVSSNVRIIWGYDNTNKAWKKYKPGVSGNTLTTIEGGKGYWVYMDVSGNITLKDASTNTEWTAQSKTVPLTEGWNLVGYNGTDNTDVATALNGISGKWSIVWYWKDNQWYAKHESSDLSVPVLDKFKKGGAYWIKIKTGQATNWVQP